MPSQHQPSALPRQAMPALFRALATLTLLLPLGAMGEDIDVFTGAAGGSAGAPRVMILVDNSNNWVQDQPNGKSKFLALAAVMNSITTPVKVGLSMFTKGAPTGGYIRFAPRDMSVSSNRTAFQSLLGGISADANVGTEAGAPKDESAALYEIYKYYSSAAPRSGKLVQNPNADSAGNMGSYAGATAAAQGLTSGFAFDKEGDYVSDTSACSKAYIIYIVANNSSGGPTGQRIYEGVDSGAPVLPAPGAPDTFADEWARFLYTHRDPQVTTYVMDAYYPDDNQDAGYSLALQSIAKQGGGSYKHVRNQAEITTELLRIFAEIKAINSTFASASLPISAANRAQNKNQVFFGMFRPDAEAKPRWFGNLKQYQLINQAGVIELADVTGALAINNNTGFIADCSTSFWTSDSGTYWQNVPVNPSVAGTCTTTSFGKFSDAPDGPFVEKGGTAEVVRKGNAPAVTNSTPTFIVNRSLYTVAAGNLVPFTAASSGLSAAVVSHASGQDVNDENNNTVTTETRPSLHGDVVHSSPLTVDYGGSQGIVAYYGSNDGVFHAVQAGDGKELWGFIAPENFGMLTRQMANSPIISYPSIPTGVTPTPQKKDYAFDGGVGIFQNANNSKVYIYPTMRRGGRMIYALDVTNPLLPAFKWRQGCPSLTNDTVCSAGFAGIGQTWSRPSVAFIKGYSTSKPVVVLGGGYDACEDQNSSTPTCASPKGAGVYIIDADSGALLRTLPTDRSVAADVAMIDIDADGAVDYAYVADTGGSLYRVDFIDGPGSRTALDATKWSIHKIAYTQGAGRKFLAAPALLQNGNKVYLAIGSGDREHPLVNDYPYAGVVNRFYVFKDDLAPSVQPAVNLDTKDTTLMLDKSNAGDCASPPVTPASTIKGWYMNLNSAGEQTVSSALIVGGMAVFNTHLPLKSSEGTCATPLGEARGYFVNLLNGSGAIGVPGSCGGVRSARFVGGGIAPSPVFATVLIDGAPKSVLIGAVKKNGGSSTVISPQQVRPPISYIRKRTYWNLPNTDN